MIKSWKKFNESGIYFEESAEFLNIKNRYSLKKENIIDYINDLEDDRDIKFENIHNSVFKYDDKELIINILVYLSKSYKNKIIELEDYKSFLKEQLDDTNYISSTCRRVAKVEDLELIRIKPSEMPFKGCGKLTMTILFQKIIQTNEMDQAHMEYMKKDNPEREAYQKVIKKLVELGIPENHAKILVDTQSDQDTIVFGFMTNYEINIIATYEKDTNKLSFDNIQLDYTLQDYNNGDCNDYY